MKYRQIYAFPSFAPLLPYLPIYHVNDDHDISNDYDQGPDTSLYKNASRAYNAYHRAANPPAPHPDTNYFSMDYGDTSFFFLDTRRYRTSNFAEDKEGKTMLGEKQLGDLLGWAKKAEERGVVWKFIISSVPMTNNWKGPDGERDTWGGFMHERGKILEVLKDVSNVVVISGVIPPPPPSVWFLTWSRIDMKLL
jgi:alkaline phosphatase D